MTCPVLARAMGHTAVCSKTIFMTVIRRRDMYWEEGLRPRVVAVMPCRVSSRIRQGETDRCTLRDGPLQKCHVNDLFVLRIHFRSFWPCLHGMYSLGVTGMVACTNDGQIPGMCLRIYHMKNMASTDVSQ